MKNYSNKQTENNIETIASYKEIDTAEVGKKIYILTLATTFFAY